MRNRYATASIDLGVTQGSWRPDKVAETVGKVVRKLLEGAHRPEFFDGREFTVRLTQDGGSPRVIVTVVEE